MNFLVNTMAKAKKHTIRKWAIYGALGVAATYGGIRYIADNVYGPPLRDQYNQLKKDHKMARRELDTLRTFKADIDERAERAAMDKELNVPHDKLSVTGTPQPEREVYLSWGKFQYKGEAIRINLQDDDGNVYKVTVINNSRMKQDDFIESWLALLNGGYGIRIRKGAKHHQRCSQQQASGLLPFPVSAKYEKDRTNVEQSMEILIDNPYYVDMVPILPGDRHYPVSAVDAGLEVTRRLQIEGLTEENAALARQFLRRYSRDLSARERRTISDISAATGRVRSDVLKRLADTYEQSLRNSEEALMSDCN